MKEELEYLIAVYRKKIEYITDLHKKANDNLTKVRLAAKASTFESVIEDLEQLVKDHEENCA